jgi:hypothetical protein
MKTKTINPADLVGDLESPATAPVGRPTKFKPEFVEQAFNLTLLGLTDPEMASVFGVSVDTLHEWRKVYPEFSESCKAGKEDADAKVARSLYRKAKGAEIVAIKMGPDGQPMYAEDGKPVLIGVQMPGDTRAQEFWLRNRRKLNWRDKQEIEHTGKDGEPLVPQANENEIARRVAFLLTNGVKQEN